MSAAVQTIWAQLIAASLADAGVCVVIVSPGSRSTPLVAALARESRLEIVTLVDERAAAFYALGVARATNAPAALACTSGTAAAHYLPAIIEASMANVPLVAITADRPPELQVCGASQTIDQRAIYGGFVRAAFDLGAPVASEASLRAVRRAVMQAVVLARGGSPGPVHIDAPFRKPLEPAAPSTPIEHELARIASRLATPDATAPLAPPTAPATPTPSVPLALPPRLLADGAMIEAVARAILDEPDGAIVVGAMPAAFAAARDNLLALAVRAGYPIIAEAGSQLRFGERDGVVCIDHFDLIPTSELPKSKLVVQLGAEPVAACWQAWLARAQPARWIFAGYRWHDPESNARAIVLGDPIDAIARLVDTLEQIPSIDSRTAAGRWARLEAQVARVAAAAIDAHEDSETAIVRAAIEALPAGAIVQLGNSLPIRVVDHLCGGGKPRTVITQRGAAGIDGSIASAAGATRAGKPVLLVLGDVSFAHDVGGLLAARDAAAAALAIVVVDNGGGQIFAGLPIGRAELGKTFDAHWLAKPEIDPAAIATAIGLRATTAPSPAAVATAVATALGSDLGRGVEGARHLATVIHAPVAARGAHAVRRAAIEGFNKRSDEHDEHRVDPVARV